MLLTVENLTKVYIKKKIINNVSFSMKKGEILGVLGKSGAGKSTIGKILLQLSRPTTGTILFEGKTLSEVPRRDIQAIFQDPYTALNPSLKIGEILEEPLIANKVFQKKEERRKKVEETLVKVGLLESDYEKYLYMVNDHPDDEDSLPRMMTEEEIRAYNQEVDKRIAQRVKEPANK